jgi:hypothetical protein
MLTRVAAIVGASPCAAAPPDSSPPRRAGIWLRQPGAARILEGWAVFGKYSCAQLLAFRARALGEVALQRLFLELAGNEAGLPGAECHAHEERERVRPCEPRAESIVGIRLLRVVRVGALDLRGAERWREMARGSARQGQAR